MKARMKTPATTQPTTRGAMSSFGGDGSGHLKVRRKKISPRIRINRRRKSKNRRRNEFSENNCQFSITQFERIAYLSPSPDAQVVSLSVVHALVAAHHPQMSSCSTHTSHEAIAEHRHVLVLVQVASGASWHLPLSSAWEGRRRDSIIKIKQH